MKKLMLMVTLMLSITIFAGDLLGETSMLNNEDSIYKLRPRFEMGFLGVTTHVIQFDTNGTFFDYVEDGGQNNLFDFRRFSMDLFIGQRHCITLLYQPLDLRTDAIIYDDLVVDGETFAANTPMEFRYGFTFYRLSYLYDFIRSDETEAALGISLQIRNATIWFKSVDGEQMRYNNNIGPVPIIKVRLRRDFPNWFIATEWDGFYASSAYINGSDYPFVGSILDASLRAGLKFKNNITAFLNLRYVGGGALGTSENNDGPGDGFTENWLSFVTVSLGVDIF